MPLAALPVFYHFTFDFSSPFLAFSPFFAFYFS